MYGPSLGSSRLGEQVEPFRIGKAGADQRDELLVEDQKLLEIELSCRVPGRADAA